MSVSSSGGTGVPARVFPLGEVDFEAAPWNAMALSVNAKTKARERTAQSANNFLVFIGYSDQTFTVPSVCARLRSARGNILIVLRRFTW